MGPLSSFSQRIAIAYAFDFISQDHYQDFELIRRIRNYFAHHPMDATFDTPEVKSLAERLTTIEDAKDVGLLKRARVAYLFGCGWTSGSLLDEMERANTTK